MITTFTTETGSIYEIDHEKQTWRRKEQGQDVGPNPLRTPEGSYHLISPIVNGERVNILCDPLVEGAHGRLISTSPVVSHEIGG